MKLHLLSGFLGSGKTTAIQSACKYLLRKNIKTGVITNDQGTKLVDGDFFKSLQIPEEQVANSCFCCNYDELDKKIASLIETYNVDNIFAESAGSCTDLVATVFNPLLRFRPQLQVTVSTFADAELLHSLVKEKQCLFDEDVKYIYHKQLQEAGIIVVSKIDLISAAKLAELKQILAENYANKTIHYQNSFDTNSIEKWLELLNDFKAENCLHPLQIDYNTYASGEAKLAWLDQETTIRSINGNAADIAVNLINSIFYNIKKSDYAIGHLKFLINGNTKVSFTSTTPVGYVYKTETQNAAIATLLINARAETAPEKLADLVSECIIQAETKSRCKIFVTSVSAFTPGYPKPTYRMASTENENKFFTAQRFILSLARKNHEVFRVGEMEEVINLYQHRGNGNVINTIPELGLPNHQKMKSAELEMPDRIWVRGAIGVAENGTIWLRKTASVSVLFPFNCEYLIVVLHANEIVSDMKEAEKIMQDSSGNFENSDAFKAKNLIIYIVDEQPAQDNLN